MRNPTRLVLIVGLLSVASIAQGAPGATCQVAITEPASGARVDRQGWVTGTAMVPKDGHLWVLVHMQALTNQWWPQANGPVQVLDGKWRVLVGYGELRDVGENFEIVAIVVGEGGHKALQEWVKRAPAQGYPSTTMPDPLPGCALTTRVVEKAAH